MYHTKFAATLIPAHLSAMFEGEGDSPEAARRSCEMQLTAYMARVRVTGSLAEAPVVKAFTCIDTDYENTMAYPRIARRNDDEKWQPKRRLGFFTMLDSLVQSLGTHMGR